MSSLQRGGKAQVLRGPGILPPEVSFWSSLRKPSNPVSQPGLLLAWLWGWGRVGKMS